PESLELREHVLPEEASRPRRLEITEDGRIWYADTGRGYLGMYDPSTDAFEEWALPAGAESDPYGMASDESGRVYVVETGVTPNRLVGFDTADEEIVSVTEIPSGAGAVRHMHYHEPSGAIWFGTDEETIGRALVAAR